MSDILDFVEATSERRWELFLTKGHYSPLDNSEVVLFTQEFLSDFFDNWDRWKDEKDMWEYYLPLLRRAALHLWDSNHILWSVKTNPKRLSIYRMKFDLNEFIDHFIKVFRTSQENFSEIFPNLESDPNSFNLSIKDYFWKLASSCSNEDEYELIVRKNKIKQILQ